MTGEPYGGVFLDGPRWVTVEFRRYPRTRFVVIPMAVSTEDQSLLLKGLEAQTLTDDVWARLQPWP